MDDALPITGPGGNHLEGYRARSGRGGEEAFPGECLPDVVPPVLLEDHLELEDGRPGHAHDDLAPLAEAVGVTGERVGEVHGARVRHPSIHDRQLPVVAHVQRPQAPGEQREGQAPLHLDADGSQSGRHPSMEPVRAHGVGEDAARHAPGRGALQRLRHGATGVGVIDDVVEQMHVVLGRVDVLHHPGYRPRVSRHHLHPISSHHVEAAQATDESAERSRPRRERRIHRVSLLEAEMLAGPRDVENGPPAADAAGHAPFGEEEVEHGPQPGQRKHDGKPAQRRSQAPAMRHQGDQ